VILLFSTAPREILVRGYLFHVHGLQKITPTIQHSIMKNTQISIWLGRLLFSQ